MARPPLTPEQRSLQGAIAALTRWAHEDPRPALERTRAGFFARFEREVDPDGVLPPAERDRRATAAMRAHMAQLALASSKARATRRASK